MEREELENQSRENAQQQDTVRAVKKDGKDQESDRRRFLKTGTALAAGGAAAYVAPSVARASASGGLSPSPVSLPFFFSGEIPFGGTGFDFSGAIDANYLIQGSSDWAIDIDGNATVTNIVWTGTYTKGPDNLGVIEITQIGDLVGTYAGILLEVSGVIHFHFVDNPQLDGDSSIVIGGEFSPNGGISMTGTVSGDHNGSGKHNEGWCCPG